MQQVFDVKTYEFPYHNFKFPGQHSEERILYITREGKIIVQTKLFLVIFAGVAGLAFGIILLSAATIYGIPLAGYIPLFAVILVLFFAGLYWWIYTIWRKTLFIITTRRLTKFIHTTPWSRYQMSLGLDNIVDTGAYQKGLLQMLTGLGYFVARSAAGSIKNFKIINIHRAEDLHNYVNKLLYTFNERKGELDRFRPFIPHMKGEARDEYVRKTAPYYAKPKRVLPEGEAEYLSPGDKKQLPEKE